MYLKIKFGPFHSCVYNSVSADSQASNQSPNTVNVSAKLFCHLHIIENDLCVCASPLGSRAVAAWACSLTRARAASPSSISCQSSPAPAPSQAPASRASDPGPPRSSSAPGRGRDTRGRQPPCFQVINLSTIYLFVSIYGFSLSSIYHCLSPGLAAAGFPPRFNGGGGVSPPGGGAGQLMGGKHGESLSRTNLYIRGLSPHTTDKDLINLCQK